ncbi:hypothetical protein SRHO_G00208290 [Serrasalmus rhombeus]
METMKCCVYVAVEGTGILRDLARRGCPAPLRAPRLAVWQGDRDGEGVQETGPESRPGTAGGKHDSRGKERDGAGCNVTVEEDTGQSECRTEEELNNDREHEHSTDPLVDTVTDIVDFMLDGHQTMLNDPTHPVLAVLSLYSLFNMDEFKVAILNVNGARDANKRALLFELLRLKHVDVMFVQETHSDEQNAVDWVREYEGRAFLSHRSSGDLHELKNWRPVSLLCCDYELLSKVLAVRLKEVVGWVIHPDETYCIPNQEKAFDF